MHGSRKATILAYFDTTGASNRTTEAMIGVTETTARIARRFPGSGNYTNHELRRLLAAVGYRPIGSNGPAMLK